MHSASRATQPKSCLKRPSAFPVVRASRSVDEDHPYDMSSASMREWDSMFGPAVSTTTLASDAETICSGASTMNMSSSDIRGCEVRKTVSFRDEHDVRIYHPEPYQPEPPHGVLDRVSREYMTIYVPEFVNSLLFPSQVSAHTRFAEWPHTTNTGQFTHKL